MQHLPSPFRLYRDQQWPLAAPAAGERDGVDLQRARGQEVKSIPYERQFMTNIKLLLFQTKIT